MRPGRTGIAPHGRALRATTFLFLPPRDRTLLVGHPASTYNRGILRVSQEKTAVETSVSDYNDTFQNLADALSESLGWEWDGRFGCVLTTFETSDKDRVSGVVSSLLDQAWDSANIDDAPARVGAAIKDFGGLHPGQLLFSSELAQGIILLGLWWPWGNGTTISIRFVPSGPANSDREVDAARAELKAAFGL